MITIMGAMVVLGWPVPGQTHSHGPAEKLAHPPRFSRLSIGKFPTRVRLGAPVQLTVNNLGSLDQKIVFQVIPKTDYSSSRDVVNILGPRAAKVGAGKTLRITWRPSKEEVKMISTGWPYQISFADQMADSYGGPVFYTDYFKFYRTKN